MSSAPAIRIEGVTKRYPTARRLRDIVLRPRMRQWTEALRGVSLDVPEGTVQGLLGANGAGKTTLLKILATLVLPTEGRAEVGGHDVTRDSLGARTILGLVVAEERSFYWRLTGRENLMFFAALHDVTGTARRQRVEELLDVVGLAAEADKSFREYSSGMRQRLSIARGLLSRPRIILMDEPTRALDPPSAAWIRTFVREELVLRGGATVVLATHDLHEAETTCDRLALVDQGLIVASGTVAELKRPLDRALRTIIEVLPPGDEALAWIRGGALPGAAVLEPAGGRARIVVTGTPDDVAACVRAIVERGGAVVSVREEESDLASLFDRALPRPAADGAAGPRA